MKPHPIHRLPAPLEAAIQRLKLAAREACERTIESLGLAALAATSVFQRDGLLAAQFELNRKSAVFALTFNDAMDERVLREIGGRGAQAPLQALAAQPTSWDALSLVEDKEVEAQITADRFAMEIAGACEWELRELDAYVATVLAEASDARQAGPGAGAATEREQERNPLRPELVGHAMIRAVNAVTEREDTRKQLLTELSRSLSALLPMAYAAIVGDFRNAGVRPVGLQVRNRAPGGTVLGGAEGDAGAASVAAALASRSGGSLGQGGPHTASGHGRHGFVPSSRSAGFGGSRGTPIGQVDPALMALLRRLSHADAVRTGTGGSGHGGSLRSGFGPGPGGEAGASDFDFGAPLPNLIHLHRDELRQASRGSVDHMVIDVIGFLFDQILADPKLPPQMARQIARLQLPVLRAALGDPSFFSSRRHPVRRFVDRVASLGAGFDDFSEDTAREFLAKVKALVGEVVDGNFDQLEVYEQQLRALEAFVVQQQGEGTADTVRILAEKEDELRLRRLYAERLSGELRELSGPAFVRDFIARTWSQVLLRASAGQPPEGGPEGALVQKFRRTARDLAMSVQPKSTPSHKKAFLAELPKMMLELTEGMNLVGWPKQERDAFFAQLMPAHAAALKAPPATPLDLNMMARRVDMALESPAPSREELRALPATALPVLDDEVALPVLSQAEAQRVGLVDEKSVDWNGQVDIDLDAVADPAERAAAEGGSARPAAPGLPALAEAASPTQGRELADVVEVGFAYRMQLHDRWEKVRLTHVSAGRAFYLFTHGKRQRQSVSLTHRMLQRLCESGRFQAYEKASLLDRATERARRQLSALGAQAR